MPSSQNVSEISLMKPSEEILKLESTQEDEAHPQVKRTELEQDDTQSSSSGRLVMYWKNIYCYVLVCSRFHRSPSWKCFRREGCRELRWTTKKVLIPICSKHIRENKHFPRDILDLYVFSTCSSLSSMKDRQFQNKFVQILGSSHTL